VKWAFTRGTYAHQAQGPSEYNLLKKPWSATARYRFFALHLDYDLKLTLRVERNTPQKSLKVKLILVTM